MHTALTIFCSFHASQLNCLFLQSIVVLPRAVDCTPPIESILRSGTRLNHYAHHYPDRHLLSPVLTDGQYVLTVVSRHWIACELAALRKSSYKQVSISLRLAHTGTCICTGTKLFGTLPVHWENAVYGEFFAYSNGTKNGTSWLPNVPLHPNIWNISR